MAPVAYASYSDVAERYGEDQLVEITPKPTDYDPENPGVFDPEAFWDRMVMAASVELDAHFSRAGYATPIVESDGTTVIAGVEPILREYAVLMALDLAQVPMQDEANPIAKAIARMKETLGRYVSGAIRLPGVTIIDKAIGAGLTTAAIAAGAANDPFRDLSYVLRATRCVPD